MIKSKLCKIVAALLILFCCAVPAQLSDCRCGRTTLESPIEGTVFSVMNGRRMRRIQGRVFYPNGEILREEAIVEVFVNHLETNDEDLSYAEVSEITSQSKVVACTVDRDGRFCITNLPAGNYLLRIGTRNEPSFSAVNVLVTLVPYSRRSSGRMLRIRLPLSI